MGKGGIILAVAGHHHIQEGCRIAVIAVPIGRADLEPLISSVLVEGFTFLTFQSYIYPEDFVPHPGDGFGGFLMAGVGGV